MSDLGWIIVITAIAGVGGTGLGGVVGALLPEAILMWRSKLPAFATVFGVLAGLVLIHI